MTKSTYIQLFAKANNYYVAQDCKVTQESPNYSSFKAACDALISSDHNDIKSDDRFRYSKLNKLFDQPSVEDLLNSDW